MAITRAGVAKMRLSLGASKMAITRAEIPKMGMIIVRRCVSRKKGKSEPVSWGAPEYRYFMICILGGRGGEGLLPHPEQAYRGREQAQGGLSPSCRHLHLLDIFIKNILLSWADPHSSSWRLVLFIPSIALSKRSGTSFRNRNGRC